jgi:hypothetical protein
MRKPALLIDRHAALVSLVLTGGFSVFWGVTENLFLTRRSRNQPKNLFLQDYLRITWILNLKSCETLPRSSGFSSLTTN